MATTRKPSLAAQLEALRVEREALLTEVARLNADNQELREWHSAALTTTNELKAELRETEEREASFGVLIDYYAGLGNSMWAIKSLASEYMELARKAFDARIKQPAPTVAPVRSTTRTVFEFNPHVEGDFARASKLARENNGTVRRAA